MRKRALCLRRMECSISLFQPDCEGTRTLTAAFLFRRNRATIFDFRRSKLTGKIAMSLLTDSLTSVPIELRWYKERRQTAEP